MKSTATISDAFFFSPAPTTLAWGEKSQRIRRPARLKHFAKTSPEEFAASKQEIVCSGILAMCLLYTFGYCFAQLAF